MGSDLNDLHKASGGEVSIRAPAWGATLVINNYRRRVAVSIRAPAWGATLIAEWLRYDAYVSIRAPAWGATSL